MQTPDSRIIGPLASDAPVANDSANSKPQMCPAQDQGISGSGTRLRAATLPPVDERLDLRSGRLAELGLVHLGAHDLVAAQLGDDENSGGHHAELDPGAQSNSSAERLPSAMPPDSIAFWSASASIFRAALLASARTRSTARFGVL